MIPSRSSGSRNRWRVLHSPNTCSMADAIGTNCSSVPLKRARTRRMISALSTRVSGMAVPGLERYRSGKLTGDLQRSTTRSDHATRALDRGQQKAGQPRQTGDLVELFLSRNLPQPIEIDTKWVREEALAATSRLGLDGRMRALLYCCCL